MNSELYEYREQFWGHDSTEIYKCKHECMKTTTKYYYIAYPN
jgi:hypothetical protein